MNKLLDNCSGCPSCINAELLVSPQLIQYWEEKVNLRHPLGPIPRVR